MNHLGAEPHDQHHRFGIGVAENLVTKVDAIGTGDLRRLMGERIHLSCSPDVTGEGIYGTVFRDAEGFPTRTAGDSGEGAQLTRPRQRCRMTENGEDKKSL